MSFPWDDLTMSQPPYIGFQVIIINTMYIHVLTQNVYESFCLCQVYAVTKLANIWFTLELSRRLQGSGVSVFSVHPGAVSTDLGRYIGGERSHGLSDTNTWFTALVPEFVSRLMAKMSSLVTISPAMGARYVLIMVSRSRSRENFEKNV